jgi:hypothetical protein
MWPKVLFQGIYSDLAMNILFIYAHFIYLSINWKRKQKQFHLRHENIRLKEGQNSWPLYRTLGDNGLDFWGQKEVAWFWKFAGRMSIARKSLPYYTHEISPVTGTWGYLWVKFQSDPPTSSFCERIPPRQEVGGVGISNKYINILMEEDHGPHLLFTYSLYLWQSAWLPLSKDGEVHPQGTLLAFSYLFLNN